MAKINLGTVLTELQKVIDQLERPEKNIDTEKRQEALKAFQEAKQTLEPFCRATEVPPRIYDDGKP